VPDLSARDVYGAAGVFHAPVTVTGRAPVVWPRRVGAVPPLATGRQSRPADQNLAAAVVGGTAVVCQVVSGLGGVGKTQLAANLAEQLWAGRQLDLLVWVTANSRTSIVSTYALAAGEVTGVDDPDREQAASRLLSWLATTDRRWLVVLDDLTNPADLTGLWPSDTPTGRTVVTTRRRDTALIAGRRLVDVGVFTPDQAVAYVTCLLGDSPGRIEQADRLAADLGFLPLALAQAAAYIADQDISCADYRDRLIRRPLIRLHPDVLPDQQSLPVGRTWALSVEAADAGTGGLAAVVLQLAALLDPNGIPAALFATRAVLDHYRPRLGREVDTDSVHDTLRALYRLSLADITPAGTGGGLLRVHALVQRVSRETTPDEDRHVLVTTAADALAELWPPIERDPATSRLAQQLRANTSALADTAGPLLWRTVDGGHQAHPVLLRAGESLGDIGLVAAARDHYTRLHLTASSLLAHDHPDNLSVRYRMARWRGEAGDAAGAAGAMEQLLADYLRVLGPDHPHTLNVRHSIARWRGEAGDTPGALAAFEQVLADRLRALGPDHPHTLATRNNLAYWRGEAGDVAGAVAAFEQLLADRLRVLGPDHPHTLSTRHNIARCWGEAGDAPAAVAAFQALLTDCLRVLGPDHPHTLSVRHNIARWRAEAGDAPGAAAALVRLLADRLRVLGPDHPDTLRTRRDLVRWRDHIRPGAGT
jgi:hypothetical protein